MKTIFYNLKDAFQNPEQVLELKLQNSNISEIPEEISQFKNLETLQFSLNNPVKLPKDLSALKKLQVLQICSDQFPEALETLPELALFTLSAYGEKELKLIKPIPQLKFFIFQAKYLKPIEENADFDFLNSFPNLEFLMAVAPHITRFPKAILQLSKLDSLNFRGTPLFDIPKEIGNLKKLEALSLAECSQMEVFPEGILELSQLKSLIVAGESFQKEPSAPNLSRLPNLEKLDLVGWHMNQIPENWGKLENLVEVRMNLNNMAAIPECIGNWKNIVKLDLSKNKNTKALPGTVGNFTKLEEFACSGLASLPTEIKKWQSLRKLDLAQCWHLKNFPEVISELANLEFLDLTETNIKTLPNSITNLTKLQEFRIINTNLREFPTQLTELPSLKIFDCTGAYLKGNYYEAFLEFQKKNFVIPKSANPNPLNDSIIKKMQSLGVTVPEVPTSQKTYTLPMGKYPIPSAISQIISAKWPASLLIADEDFWNWSDTSSFRLNISTTWDESDDIILIHGPYVNIAAYGHAMNKDSEGNQDDFYPDTYLCVDLRDANPTNPTIYSRSHEEISFSKIGFFSDLLNSVKIRD